MEGLNGESPSETCLTHASKADASSYQNTESKQSCFSEQISITFFFSIYKNSV